MKKHASWIRASKMTVLHLFYTLHPNLALWGLSDTGLSKVPTVCTWAKEQSHDFCTEHHLRSNMNPTATSYHSSPQSIF